MCIRDSVRTVTDELGTCGLTTPFLFSSLARSSRVRRLIVVFTKYDTMLVTPIIHRAPRGGSTEQVWQNAEREANKVFEVLCIGPFTKAIDEVLSKKVPNANLSVPIKVSGRLMSHFDISCTDDDCSLRYPY